MIAIDTNVLVRLLVNDDEAQGSRARAVFEVEEIWIGKTVLLETFWVLRSVYDFKDIAIARAIEGALGLPRLQTALISRMRCMLLRPRAMRGPSQPSIKILHVVAKRGQVQ